VLDNNNIKDNVDDNNNHNNNFKYYSLYLSRDNLLLKLVGLQVFVSGHPLEIYSLLQIVQTGSGTHPVPYIIGTGGYLHSVKAAIA
jgi:hypothetical protein